VLLVLLSFIVFMNYLKYLIIQEKRLWLTWTSFYHASAEESTEPDKALTEES
jgi:hypothetical protein